MSHRIPYPRRVGTFSLEATAPEAALDLSAADEWRGLITLHGVPCNYIKVPSGGGTMGPGVVNAALVRQADEMGAWDQFVEAFRRRLGVPVREPVKPSCSVVMCTHRRPDYIGEVLGALRRLDPPADEIVVVDNDPGDRDCREQVAEAGGVYVREDRRGLDNARNAGLRVARGELVAFTDDDCVPPARWLRSLPELFDDPTVAVVTGPAFAYALDTRSQARFEDQGGHRRGVHRRRFDWKVLTPIAATRAGAGLNMVFRRSALDGLGEVFPPELDAGTPTESGGDTYALYKVLRAGYRVVYDPGTFVFHQHRPDPRSLHRAIRGYGIGLTAVLTKILVEERELATPTVWHGLWRLYKDAVRSGLAGRLDPVEVRIGWDYLLGGLLGARAWWSSKRRFARDAPARPDRRPPAVTEDPAEEPAPTHRPSPRRTAAAGGVSEPAVSVVVAAPSPGSEARCLAALGRQQPPDASLEVLVVGSDERNGPSTNLGGGIAVSHVHTDVALGMRNLGARHARGGVLLFLDADARPGPDLVTRHLERHREGDHQRLVVGRTHVTPARGSLAALHESVRWRDHFERKRTAAALTFADVLGSNTSLARDAFERLGGFDVDLERVGREGWELGVRALQAGIDVVYEPAAVAVREASSSAAVAIEAARREGHGDALLRARHPLVSPSLPDPPDQSKLLKGPLSRVSFAVLRRPSARRCVATAALPMLERLRARRTWLHLFWLTRSAAYEDGVSTGGGRPLAASPHVTRVELTSDDPIPAPSVAPPVVELAIGGKPAGRVKPTGGQWHPHIADDAAHTLGSRLLEVPHRRLPALEETPQGRDLSGTAVLFGPGRVPGDERYRGALEAAGAQVAVLEGDRSRHWDELDRGIRTSGAQIVALPLPGVTAAPSWIAGARLALDGDRIAAAVGAGLPPWKPPQRLFVGSRRRLPLPYTPLGQPSQYILVRPTTYEALGGFDSATARLGRQGPILDFLERALDEGYLIAYRDIPWAEPLDLSGGGPHRTAWERHQARGGLMLRRARQTGGARGWGWFVARGLAPFAADLGSSLRAEGPSPVRVLAGAVAFVSGSAIAAGAMSAPRSPHP